MPVLVAVSLEAIVLIAVVSLFQVALLAFRNPYRPVWLHRLGTAVVLAFLTSLVMAVAALITSLIRTDVSVFVAAGIGAALPLAAAFFNAWAFGLRERLRRAEAGESPFYAPEWLLHRSRPASPH